jgi:hypothetical protein
MHEKSHLMRVCAVVEIENPTRKPDRSPWEIVMDRKSSALAIRPLVVVALVWATLITTVRSYDAAVAIPDQVTRDQLTSAPIILAQGRCFNGRCF